MKTTSLLSIVLPIMNEEENIVPLLNEIESVMASNKIPFEVVAVDDGSTDGTRAILEAEYKKRDWLKVIFFRRNFGQTASFDAGFRYSSGDVIVTMDADGQNDPADIPRMLEVLETGYDFVAGWRKNRKDAAIKRNLPSKIANYVIRKITKTKLKDLGCSLKVYRKEIVADLNLYGEMHRFIGVLVEGVGARLAEVEVNHRPRMAGVSKYNLSRTFKVILDLITVWFLRSYQTKPIYVFGGMGMFLCGTSVLGLIVVAYQRLSGESWVHRNPLFIIALIFGVIGVQFIVLGLLAEMLVRAYFESQNKRPFIISRTLNRTENHHVWDRRDLKSEAPSRY